MVKSDIGKSTGELIIAIGNGTFRDAVAMLMDRVSREAYINGTHSSNKALDSVIERRWEEFDTLFCEAVEGNGLVHNGARWKAAAMAANKMRNLTI